MSVLPWELPEDEYERRYWVDRFYEYIELENDPAVIAYRKKKREQAEKRNKGLGDRGAARAKGEAKGWGVKDGGKD